MNEHNTVEKMRRMRMNAMASLYHSSLTDKLFQDYSLDSFLSMLIDAEWENRQNRNIQNLITRAGFKQAASAADVDYKAKRNLDRTTYERLLGLNFISRKENVIITGPTGCGKSFLAQCIGVKACQLLNKTMYFNTSRFFDLARLAKLEGTYHRLIKKIQTTELFILDDFGLATIDQPSRNVLMDVVEERHEKSSTIIATQIPVSNWHGLIGESTIADAILDRIVFSSHRIELEGESLRKNKKLST